MSESADPGRQWRDTQPRFRAVLGLGRPQERRLLAAWRDDASVRIAARCASAPQVLETLRRGEADVALIDEDLHLLDDEHALAFEASQFPVVMLARNRAANPFGGRVIALSADADAARVLESMAEAFLGVRTTRVQRPATASTVTDRNQQITRVIEAAKPIQVIAFWSGAGSPGRTTAALNLCAVLGAEAPTVLVDLDLTAAGVASQLDLGTDNGVVLCQRANLLQLAAVNPDSDEAWSEGLGRMLLPLGSFSPHARVLAGVPTPRSRDIIGPAFTDELIAQLRRRFAHVLLDVGDELLDGHTTEALVAKAALRSADHVLVVCRPDAPGLHQTHMAIAVAGDVLNGERASLIVNRFDRRQHQEHLGSIEFAVSGLPLVCVLPLDYAVVERAVAAGRPAVCESRSALRHPLVELAKRIRCERIHAPAYKAGRVSHLKPGGLTARLASVTLIAVLCFVATLVLAGAGVLR
jgi:MinD-like ATPase involved in chromosome partitioning or flagellar assembly